MSDRGAATPPGTPRRPAADASVGVPRAVSADAASSPADEVERLRARIATLEADHRRAFDQAQREADALFAQYQLSQLIASGGTPLELGRAVVAELVRLASADAGAIWLGEVGRPGLGLVATTGRFDPPIPERLADLGEGRQTLAQLEDIRLIVLGEEPPATLVALRTPAGRELDGEGLRVLQLARHEVAVAFASARLREALERERHDLGAVVDGATDVILQVDASRTVVRLNPAGERTLGLAAAAAVGRTCDEVLGCALAGDHGPDACPLGAVIATGEPIGYRETVIQPVGGAPMTVAGSYSRAPVEPGGAVRSTAILRDITAVRALEQLREGFVATVSHELRTPLALVRGYAESVLHLDLDPERQREYVDRIHQVTSRLGALVDGILDVTHLDADPLILERSRVALTVLVARLRGDLRLAGEDDRLVDELPPDLPPVEVDPGRVARILENLVGNALKYAPDGSPVVVSARVAAASETGPAAWLVVTVDDEGVGIPADERGLVVEPFHRAWNVRESRIPGTGLGLYICRRLVEAHGGRLWLDDRPDGRPGTRVAFTLPLTSAATQTEAAVEAATPAVATAPAETARG